MTPVIVIRPQPGCDATVAAARAAGLTAQGFPLFSVEPLAWTPPPRAEIDAVLIGSANALRHGGKGIAAYRGMPAYTVGRTSAEAAQAAGLEVVLCGEGGLQPVLERLRPEHQRLLRLAGEARIDLSPPAGVSMIERIVYASRPQPMLPALAELLREPALVLLHSAEAGRHFAELCDSSGIARDQVSLAAIGPRVVAAVGAGWRAVETANNPDDAALLALARRMCETGGGRD